MSISLSPLRGPPSWQARKVCPPPWQREVEKENSYFAAESMKLCAAFAPHDRILQPRRRILSWCLLSPDPVSTSLGGPGGSSSRSPPQLDCFRGSSEGVTERGRGEGRRERSPTCISGLRGGKKEKWGRMEALSPV